MKSLPVGYAAHLATRSTTIATALKITREDSAVYGFTTHDIDDEVPVGSGVIYRANPGLEITAIEIAANPAVGNLVLTTLHDQTTFTTAEILGQRWRNAAFELFRYNWANIADGIEILLVGNLGEITIKQNTLQVELRDLRQYLQQPVGDASSKTCRARLGDARCKVNLAPWTVTGTVGVVTNQQQFIDFTRPEPHDFFGEGIITFTSGANEGLSAKIRYYTGAAPVGTFILALPMLSPIVAGDTYTAVAGCRKRLMTDCKAKFNNVLNFVGEPHRRGINNVTGAPEADAPGSTVAMLEDAMDEIF